MTWSISASGSKERVKQAVESQITNDHSRARAGILALVDDLEGNRVSVSGSGASNTISLSISSWDEAEPVPEGA